MRIQAVSGGELHSPALRGEALEILRPYYEDATELLNREWAITTTAYTATDDANRLQAFFLVGWTELMIGGQPQPAVYLGLSANRQETRRSFQVSELYDLFVNEARKWQQMKQARLICWFTTATPAAFTAAATVFSDLAPDESGSMSERALAIAAAVRAKYALPQEEGCHPAVLRGVASGTRYSVLEREAIAAISQKTGCRILETLKVDEAVGDRLLVSCFISDGP